MVIFEDKITSKLSLSFSNPLSVTLAFYVSFFLSSASMQWQSVPRGKQNQTLSSTCAIFLLSLSWKLGALMIWWCLDHISEGDISEVCKCLLFIWCQNRITLNKCINSHLTNYRIKFSACFACNYHVEPAWFLSSALADLSCEECALWCICK